MDILIDAGHGGNETGAYYGGIAEKHLNLECALMLEKKFQKYQNVNVKMTRTKDVKFELNGRCRLIKSTNADLTYSCHFNAGGGQGVEIIKSHKAPKNIDILADMLGGKISAGLGIPLRRVFYRKNRVGNDYYAVHRLGNSRTILLEGLFLDCASDVRVLKSAGFMDLYTDLIVESTVRVYDLERKVTELNPHDIIKMAASEPEKWFKGINTAVAAAKADGNLGDLEIFEYLPILIMKIYHLKH